VRVTFTGEKAYMPGPASAGALALKLRAETSGRVRALQKGSERIRKRGFQVPFEEWRTRDKNRATT